MKNPYVVVSMDALMPQPGKNIRATLKAVYMALRSFSNWSYEPVYPSYAQIAERAGLKSTRTIYNAVHELEALGLITVETKAVYGKVNRYHFTFFDHSTHDSNAQGYAKDSSVKKNHNHGKEESDSSLHKTIMPTTLNHRNLSQNPKSSELESTNHSPSPEDERFYSAAIHYFNLAANDYDSFNPNDRFTANTLAILRQKFPELQPFDLYHFPTWYKKHVRGKLGELYRLPIKPEPLTTHLAKFLAAAARLDIKKLADAGLDVDCMTEGEINIAAAKIKYADLIGD